MSQKLIGERFGRLTVLGFVDKNTHGDKRWECMCDCGEVVVVFGNNLNRGHSKSCGCIERDRPNATIHGLKNHPLYKAWKGIKTRCYNPRDKAYRYYGARGVKLCDEWMNNPKKFVEWGILNGWRKGLVVDKDIKPLKNGVSALLYSPETLSFVTQKENLQYTRQHKKYKNVGI